MILAWPSGKILRIANGTTAGDVFAAGQADGPESSSVKNDSVFLVNVNNRLVPSSTKLSDGDFVVVSVGKEADRFEKVQV